MEFFIFTKTFFMVKSEPFVKKRKYLIKIAIVIFHIETNTFLYNENLKKSCRTSIQH